MSNVSNTDDIIDSRDVIERIAELEGSEDPEQQEELNHLLALQEEAEDYAPDWRYGATLIHEDYFTKYAQQLCEDIGDVSTNLPDYIVIDWEATAKNLLVDYTSVDFDGATYYVR